MSGTKTTATIDPDSEWAYAKNVDYSHTAWYTSADGAFEKRVARESPMDSFSGLNWNKVPNGPGEYYSTNSVPLFDNEWNEEEYYRDWVPDKTDEQVTTELAEPIDRLEEKYTEFTSKGEEVLWTPALARMVDTTVAQARKLEYEISPYFQLNKQGFRKNLSNTRICEMRPMNRLTQSSIGYMISDYVYRFQMMRWNLTARVRLKYFKFIMGGGAVMLIYDHTQSREYRRKWKWH